MALCAALRHLSDVLFVLLSHNKVVECRRVLAMWPRLCISLVSLYFPLLQVQSARILHARRGFNTMLAQHALILLVCAARAVAAARYRFELLYTLVCWFCGCCICIVQITERQ